MLFLERLWGTVQIRPYVFAFLLAFAVVSLVQIGARRTLIFAVVGGLLGFGSEALSVHTGFPYGHYEYLSLATRDKELWALGVPLMASVSFVFIAYAGLAAALAACSPVVVAPRGLRFAAITPALRSAAVLLSAPFFITALDVVTDPVALQGKRWFLGDLYRYDSRGLYFGVPLSNFLGWLLTSFLIVLLFQVVDRRLLGRVPSALPDRGREQAPVWPGIAFYAAIFVFNISVSFAIGSVALGLACVAIGGTILAAVLLRLKKSVRTAEGDVHLHRAQLEGSDDLVQT